MLLTHVSNFFSKMKKSNKTKQNKKQNKTKNPTPQKTSEIPTPKIQDPTAFKQLTKQKK